MRQEHDVEANSTFGGLLSAYPLQVSMRRALLIAVMLLLLGAASALSPVTGELLGDKPPVMSAEMRDNPSASESEEWRDNEIDPATWEDGPTLEGSPMDTPHPGDPVVRMVIRYTPDLGGSEVEGEVILELFPKWVPTTAFNFAGLAESQFYDGIFFHRVIDDFVAQSGDPSCKTVGVYPGTNVNCGEDGSGQTIPLEHDENMSHVDGAIGMARSLDPDSAESQFYLCDGEQHQLDPENRDDEGYATFGVVRDGMSHVRAVAAVPTSNDPFGILHVPPAPDRPVDEVRLVSVELIGVVMWGDNHSNLDSDSSLFATGGVVGFMVNSLFLLWALALIGVAGWNGWNMDNEKLFPFLKEIFAERSRDVEIEGAVDAVLVEGP